MTLEQITLLEEKLDKLQSLVEAREKYTHDLEQLLRVIRCTLESETTIKAPIRVSIVNCIDTILNEKW